jgi:hypothetical protein
MNRRITRFIFSPPLLSLPAASGGEPAFITDYALVNQLVEAQRAQSLSPILGHWAP